MRPDKKSTTSQEPAPMATGEGELRMADAASRGRKPPSGPDDGRASTGAPSPSCGCLDCCGVDGCAGCRVHGRAAFDDEQAARHALGLPVAPIDFRRAAAEAREAGDEEIAAILERCAARVERSGK